MYGCLVPKCCSDDAVATSCPDNSTHQVYILLEDRLEALFHSPADYSLLDKMTGSSLVGKKYKPLFNYFAHLKSDEPDKGAFRILRQAAVLHFTCQRGLYNMSI